MKIYCFSGLGADKRVFQYLDLGAHECIHVEWIKPLENESLKAYALRLGKVIDENERVGLMGFSFGGMIVQELAQVVNPEKVVVLSCMAHQGEKPLRMRILKALKLYDLVPDRYFIQPSKIAYKLFGTQTTKERSLLDEIIKEGDPRFIRWALSAIGGWSNTVRVDAFRMHGDCDPLFPLKYVKPNYIVKGGSHMMLVSHSQEIQQQIRMYLER